MGVSLVRFGGSRIQDRVKTGTQGRVDDLFERFPKSRCTLLCLCSHIWVKRQGGSHVGIMMSIVFLVNDFSRLENASTHVGYGIQGRLHPRRLEQFTLFTLTA